MDHSNEISVEFPNFVRMYKNGKIEWLVGTTTVPPSVDSKTGVTSKDIQVIPELDVSARIYLPKVDDDTPKKLPLLVYFHGGGFCVETPFSPVYHPHLNTLAAESNALAVSVNYRLAPEHPLPAAYDDCWSVLLWLADHVAGEGPESWVNEYADFSRLIVAGDSAGANLAHHMALRAGPKGLRDGAKIKGAILVHPYFWGSEPIGSEGTHPVSELVKRIWMMTCPSELGCDDPLINPVGPGAPSLEGLGCERMLVCVAEKDALRDRGWLYYNALGESGWLGMVEIMETEGEDHVFHLFNPTCEKAAELIKRLVLFIDSI